MTHSTMTEPTIITLGCRLNAHESDTVAAYARAASIPDAVIVNTCAVTSESVRQAAQTIRRIKRERPQARVIVTGCAAELEPARFAAMPDVDAVLGNSEKLDRESYVALARANEQLVLTGGAATARKVEPPAHDANSKTRATLAVQNGCDHRCTFCIIPYARGQSRSLPMADAVESAKRFVAAGHKEVVLTGVDLTSYAAESGGAPALGQLVRAILSAAPDLPRLRLSSIDPAEIDADLLACIASEPRLMPHFHLSLQSGDDMVLKRMRRRHTRADAIRFTQQVRSLRPDVVFGADLIAGFPTETEAMFEQTLSSIRDCSLTNLHIFPYSPRPGTPAARMPQLPGKIVMARAARLRQEGKERLQAFLASEVGAIREVLVERGGKGRTPQFLEVAIDDPPSAGVIVSVTIVGHDGRRLLGRSLPGVRSYSPSAASRPDIEVGA